MKLQSELELPTWAKGRAVFGNRAAIAFETEVSSLLASGWLYASFQLWLDGVALLNEPATSVDLATCARYARVFLHASSRRSRPELDVLDPLDAYHQLIGKFYKTDAWKFANLDVDAHLFDDVCESAVRDLFSIGVYRRGDQCDRFLVCSTQSQAVREYVIEPNATDSTVLRMAEWVERIFASCGLRIRT